MKLTYWRIYADEAGECHAEEVEAELVLRDFAPPAPPMYLSELLPATGIAFVRFPAGSWVVGEGDALLAVVQLPV